MQKIIFFLIFLPTVVFSDTTLGERLVQQLWKDIQQRNIHKIKKYTSKEFQSLHWFGAYNRFQELDFIKDVHLTSYQLSNIRVSEGKNLIVVSYDAWVEETIHGIMESGTAPRLSVWKKYSDEWKWINHANLTHHYTETKGVSL